LHLINEKTQSTGQYFPQQAAVHMPQISRPDFLNLKCFLKRPVRKGKRRKTN
jgi:hypothetical protein